jgi:hypothetical protein
MAARTMIRLVAELDAALEIRTDGGSRPEGEVKRKFSTVVRDSGWKQRSHLRMERLQKSLEETAVYPSEDLTDLSIPLSTTIRFRREAPLPPVMEFANEKDLERFIARNHRLLFGHLQGLDRLRHVAGGTRPQKRYAFGSSHVRPDLVFETRDGTTVVVEVKLGDPDDRAVTQMRRYLSSASEHSDRVRGLLISGRPRSRARESAIAAEFAAVRSHNIDWIQYSVDVKTQIRVT